MAAGSDIIWTSQIPAVKQLEKTLGENGPVDTAFKGWLSGVIGGEQTEGQVQATAPAHAEIEPAFHVTNGLVVFLFLVIIAVLVKKGLKSGELSDEDLIPSEKLTLGNAFELIVTGITKIMEDSMGDVWPRFLRLIGTLALFILFCNLAGLVPGFLPPTENINTTAGCALIIFFATHYYGLKEHGASYLKHFLGPMPAIAPLMLPIEIISHLARPLSLTLRLFGNIMGDHKVGAIFFGIAALGLPIASNFLGVFVSFMQAFVFSLLSMVYISGAIAHEH